MKIFVYKDIKELEDFLVSHMSNETFLPERARKFLGEQLSKLNYRKAKANK